MARWCSSWQHRSTISFLWERRSSIMTRACWRQHSKRSTARPTLLPSLESQSFRAGTECIHWSNQVTRRTSVSYPLMRLSTTSVLHATQSHRWDKEGPTLLPPQVSSTQSPHRRSTGRTSLCSTPGWREPTPPQPSLPHALSHRLVALYILVSERIVCKQCRPQHLSRPHHPVRRRHGERQ